MKDNINTGLILNRKIVMELRFKPSPKIFDIKGSIISSIESLNLFPKIHWEIGDAVVSIKDNNEPSKVRNQIIIDLNRLAFICTKIDSIDSFFSKFQKIYSELNKIIGISPLTRIGCRIQGTYKVKSQKFDSILESFKKSFPTTTFLEEFPTNDLMLRINYNNGMYIIGPIKENDDFLKKHFPFDERNNSVGIGIDTDNFLLSINESEVKENKIKDVLTASLAVEKSLYEKLKDF
jgi:hypothetical protein